MSDRHDDFVVQMYERSTLPCIDCELDEPHACERAWWKQQLAHYTDTPCSDPDCRCQPCECCGATVRVPVPLAGETA